MSERWKNIQGFPSYKVSSNGRVAAESTSGTKQIKPYEKDNGYLYVDLYKSGQRFGKRVHILVAEAFLNKPSSDVTVDHKDRNRHNNRVSNLKYATASEQNTNRKSWAKG
ncbi:HNH endonuclease [Enterococcus avium]|uniref:NUMOD4 domain-containing protein n=1 Tax=Enterococcus TaxID=1350 RepID=UPI002073BF99|nr:MULTISPECIES: NUMOD4 domain-containing protein [Enterococcus]MDT2438238.1 HNH endonuclease [Enterococcus avium]MDT2467848.1 HNH endonuclease [Enterococcus avium]MDT2507236.1 HNH endonuclease [Enterococcus avium]